MLKPVRDMVYARPIFDELKTKSGLYIPEQAVERCDQGIVMYLGPGVVDLSIGDYILFPNYTGTLMYIEDERLIMMQSKYVTAILDMEHNQLPISGLYHKGVDGEYFPATYESSFESIASSLSYNPHFKDWRVINRGRRNEV